MPLRKPVPQTQGSACAAVLALGLAIGAPAAADVDDFDAAGLRQLAPLTREHTPRPPEWMGENVSFEKGYGLGYKRKLRLGETPLQLGFKGPVVRKKKSLGLTVEVRF
jgi:hypothetical protein